MRSITRLLKIPGRFPSSRIVRSFSEDARNGKIFISLSPEEIEKCKHDKFEKTTLIDFAERLKNEDIAKSMDLSKSIKSELEALYSIEDLHVSVAQEFTSTRNLNKSNHDLTTMLRDKYKKNEEKLSKLQLQMKQKIALEKAESERNFAVSLIGIVNQLLANSQKIKDMEGKSDAGVVANTLEGIKLIERNALSVLKRFGVEQIDVKKGSDADGESHKLSSGASPSKGSRVKSVITPGFKKDGKVLVKAVVECE